MDIKLEIEKMVDNSNAQAAFRTTLPLLQHLISSDVNITESIFRYYFNHIISAVPDKSSKDSLEFYYRDIFAHLSALIADPTTIEVKLPEKEVKQKPNVESTPDDTELTPEMIAASQADLPPYVEPKPSEWFLNFKKQLGIKEE